MATVTAAAGAGRLSSQALGGAAPAHVVQAVAEASQRTGVSFSYLMTKASTESNFDPTAKARNSSATGLYQFLDRTWLDVVDRHGAEYGLGDMANAITRRSDGTLTVSDRATRQKILDLRKDPRISALMAAEYAEDNRLQLASRLNREISDTDLYLAHFLGAGGASKFLRAMARHPNQSAAAVMPAAAAANHSVFYTSSGRAKTLSEVYASFENKFETVPDYAPPPTEFRDASASQLNTGVQMASVQPGAVPGAATPFLTTYLLSALEAPAEVDHDENTGLSRYRVAPGAVAQGASLIKTLA